MYYTLAHFQSVVRFVITMSCHQCFHLILRFFFTFVNSSVEQSRAGGEGGAEAAWRGAEELGEHRGAEELGQISVRFCSLCAHTWTCANPETTEAPHISNLNLTLDDVSVCWID